jgi:hypothetical protein
MAVSEVLQAIGSFSINLKDTTPRSIIENTLDYFGHIAIVPGRVNPLALGDNMLSAARYTGVLRSKAIGDQITLEGGGMILWLGDEDEKGNVIENVTTFASASFPNTIRGLLPPAITEGTLYSIPGTYTGTHQWQTPRAAISYVCDTFNGAFRVNNNGTLDAGPAANLFVTDPRCIIVRKNIGRDMVLQGIPGTFETTRDVADFTTRVVLLAQGDGADIATGSANINPVLNTYKDIHGNAVVRTRLVSESDTTSGNATTRAQLQLNRFTSTRNALSLSATEYDIKGEFAIGDSVWVYDPDAGLYNTANEVTYRGQRINPIALQVVETSWPIIRGMTVAFRDKAGNWTDLTDYVEFESGATSLTVGDFSKQLTSSGFEPVGSRPSSDTSVPAAPAFVTPFTSAVYIDGAGFTKARISVRWTVPNNEDGSTIQDGDHYEIRYGVDTDMIYPSRWANVAVERWQDMQTWGQPFVYPDGGLWSIAYAPWGDTSLVINDLSPGVGYDFQIRAIDTTGHQGDWSATTTSVSLQDNIPPAAPAGPEVAASMVGIQVLHRLGIAAGGTFNLDNDLDHLNVHVGTGADFYPDESTLVGRLTANAGMISAQIPAVGSFKIDSTVGIFVKVVAVDKAGNKSVPSASVQSTAILIDDAHITDLTVSKVTAGTITADWIVGARIKTSDTGARVEMNSGGIGAWNASNVQTVSIAAADGNVNILGTFASGITGRKLVINPLGLNADPEIRFYDQPDNWHYITSFASAPTQLQMGSVIGGIGGIGRSLIEVSPTDAIMGNYQVVGGALNTIASVAALDDGNVHLSTLPGGRLELHGTTITSAGNGASFEAQAGPGTNGSFRFFWSAGAINIVRNDLNSIVKTFIIDHPQKPDNYLIHATTESPHNGVEYWGGGELDGRGEATIKLPDYFEALTEATHGRSIFVSSIAAPAMLSATLPEHGRFYVYGPAGTAFSWLVKAVRKDVPPLLVEPLRSDVDVYGDGPYRYYAQKGQ